MKSSKATSTPVKSKLLNSAALRLTIVGCWLFAVGGCGGPRLGEAEIGQPVFQLPKLPGSEEPYPMPELDKPADGPNRENGAAGPPAAPKNPASKSSEPPAAPLP